mmetsp:Transcript_35549/g.111220  ORF Transcript_35549/g.111220 Transcript_35549/m.111220 type:complete len:277 (-) Transcript_35549:89-919(-)
MVDTEQLAVLPDVQVAFLRPRDEKVAHKLERVVIGDEAPRAQVSVALPQPPSQHRPEEDVPVAARDKHDLSLVLVLVLVLLLLMMMMMVLELGVRQRAEGWVRVPRGASNQGGNPPVPDCHLRLAAQDHKVSAVGREAERADVHHSVTDMLPDMPDRLDSARLHLFHLLLLAVPDEHQGVRPRLPRRKEPLVRMQRHAQYPVCVSPAEPLGGGGRVVHDGDVGEGVDDMEEPGDEQVAAGRLKVTAMDVVQLKLLLRRLPRFEHSVLASCLRREDG